MHPKLREAYEAELATAITQYNTGDFRLAFSHLERAHILAQCFNVPHAQAHWWMLKIGWRRQDVVEITGQLPRILGALLFSSIWVPKGNTGGARVPPFKSMPIPDDLLVIVEKYGRGAKAD